MIFGHTKNEKIGITGNRYQIFDFGYRNSVTISLTNKIADISRVALVAFHPERAHALNSGRLAWGYLGVIFPFAAYAAPPRRRPGSTGATIFAIDPRTLPIDAEITDPRAWAAG